MKDTKFLEILLVNDDEDDAFILHEVAQGFTDHILLRDVRPVDNILESLEHPNLPDIVFLEIFMSKYNGLELLKQIRSKKHLKNLPVIIYSSRQHSTIVRRCFDSGATLFVEKPHTYKGIERMLKKIIAMDWQKDKVKSKEPDFIIQTED